MIPTLWQRLRARARVASGLGVAFLLALLFHRPLLFGGWLRGRDWGYRYHDYDWIRIALQEYHTLPLFMADPWLTSNLLADASYPLPGPLLGLLTVLSTQTYLKLLIVLYTWLGLTGTFLVLREFGAGRPVAALVSLIFCFHGWFPAHLGVGHPWALGLYLIAPVLLLYQRAALGSVRALWAAAALNAIALFEGQHYPCVWLNLFTGAYGALWAVSSGSWRPLRTWLIFVVASAGLGAVKFLPVLAEFHDYAPQARIGGFPPRALFWSLLAPGQDATTAGFGVQFGHGSGWWEYAAYTGVPAFVLCSVGFLGGMRRCWTLAVTGGLFLLLAVDWSLWHPSLDLWAALKSYPVFSSQRAPSRMLGPALFAFLIVSAVGLQRLYDRTKELRTANLWLPVLAAIAICGVAVDLFTAARPWQLAAVGDPIPSRSHRMNRPTLVGDAAGSASWVEYRPNRLVVAVTATRDSDLVFPMQYQEQRDHWHIDGFESKSRGGRFAISLPAGRHEILLTYRPRFFRVGAGVSLLTGLIAVAWLVRARRGANRPGAFGVRSGSQRG